MKKALSIILSLVILLSVTAGLSFSAYAETSGVLTYTASGGNAVIKKCAANASGDVVIPSEIDGNTVTEISAFAFENCNGIVSITVPDTVSVIGNGAFSGCTKLVSVNIPNGVTELSNSVFSNCTSLKSVAIPDTVEKINYEAFYGCKGLITAIIPNSVKSIGDWAFAGCYSLKRVKMGNAVESLGSYTFYDCYALIMVNIPDSVKTIGDNAFLWCENLKLVGLGKGVTAVAKSAFAECTSITDVYYAGNKTEWGKVKFAAENTCLTGAAIHYSSQMPKYAFTDLGGFTAYDNYVLYTSVYNSFIAGTNPPKFTQFSPKTSITRAMFVTILYRMAGAPYDNGANPHKSTPFTDIADKSVYYYNAACWALDKGVTTEKTFKPNNAVTREQTATFLFRYANENGYTDDSYNDVSLDAYSDSDTVSGWALSAMQWANQQGMITGTQQGTLNPKGSTLRIHATKILYGFGTACSLGYFD